MIRAAQAHNARSGPRTWQPSQSEIFTETSGRSKALLETVTANLTAEDTPVFLGDYIDRSSRRCLPAIGASSRGCDCFYESDGAVFVHAGVDPDGGAPAEQDPRDLTWGLVRNFPGGYRGPHKVVYGHRNDCVVDAEGWPRPRIVNELTFGIDSVSTEVLTAIRMPDGEVFQGERFL